MQSVDVENESRSFPVRIARSRRYTCAGCGDRPARFRYHGEVRADRDHNLCFQCFRAERDRQRLRPAA
jgi:hypothetical protein